MAKNRIQVINWRSHGDDENYCKIGVFAADEERDLMEDIQQEVDEEHDWKNSPDPEQAEDWDHVIYVNDDFTFVDGQVMENNGRKFRISIEEVK